MTIQFSSSLKIPTAPAVNATAQPKTVPAATNFSGSDSVHFSGVFFKRKQKIEIENQRLPEETRNLLKSTIPLDPKVGGSVTYFVLLLELLENALRKKNLFLDIVAQPGATLYDILLEAHPSDQSVLKEAFEELRTKKWITVEGTQDRYQITPEAKHIIKKYFFEEITTFTTKKRLNTDYPKSIKAMKKKDFGQE